MARPDVFERQRIGSPRRAKSALLRRFYAHVQKASSARPLLLLSRSQPLTLGRDLG